MQKNFQKWYILEIQKPLMCLVGQYIKVVVGIIELTLDCD